MLGVKKETFYLGWCEKRKKSPIVHVLKFYPITVIKLKLLKIKRIFRKFGLTEIKELVQS